MFVQSLHPQISQNSGLNIIGVGLPASPGGVSGKVAFRAEEAIRMSSKGMTVILVRSETSSEDIRVYLLNLFHFLPKLQSFPLNSF